MRPIEWHGDSRERIREFPEQARLDVGFALERVQRGLAPTDAKPMSTVGAGVMEIRAHFRGEYRVLYVAKFADAVHVLHAFSKKSQKTPKPDLELASQRYRELLAKRG